MKNKARINFYKVGLTFKIFMIKNNYSKFIKAKIKTLINSKYNLKIKLINKLI